MSKNKTFKAVVMSGIVLASFVGTSSQNHAFSSQRAELTPDEELIFRVKGCKGGAALLVGMINPIAGALVAASPSSESQSDLYKIQLALDKGADVNCRDHQSWTALMHASYGGYPGIVEFLLAKGARKDLVVTQRSAFSDWTGYTAFTIAKHYLEKYQGLQRGCKPDMVEHYAKSIATYTVIMNLLK